MTFSMRFSGDSPLALPDVETARQIRQVLAKYEFNSAKSAEAIKRLSKSPAGGIATESESEEPQGKEDLEAPLDVLLRLLIFGVPIDRC